MTEAQSTVGTSQAGSWAPRSWSRSWMMHTDTATAWTAVLTLPESSAAITTSSDAAKLRSAETANSRVSVSRMGETTAGPNGPTALASTRSWNGVSWTIRASRPNNAAVGFTSPGSSGRRQ